ncbi:MAG: hypothetical protein HC918_08460 [Oscillatoriales cyanobacterium SM2_1_8]|nr:hypothetical protein [Oscillatoriales cyanobacterium SM2_1_8]
MLAWGWIGAFVLLVGGAAFFGPLLQLRRLVLRYPQYQMVPESEVPEWLQQFLSGPCSQLEALGFAKVGWLRLDLPTDRQTYRAVLHHPLAETYGAVGALCPAELLQAFEVYFSSVAVGGALLLTANGRRHLFLQEPPNVQLDDPYVGTIAAQWEHHQQRCQAWGTEFLPQTLTEYQQACAESDRQALDLLIDQKLLRRQPGGRILMTNALAWRFGAQVGQAGAVVQPFVRARQQAIAADPTEAVVIPPELEAAAYHQQAAQTQSRGLGRSWLFLGTLGLFLLSFRGQGPNAWGLNPWILAAVVGYHEAGHALAMGCFGYRDTSVFFVPFVGGATTGRKAEASVAEKFWVLMAGPLPGLVVGGMGAFWLATHPETVPAWALEAIVLLLALNFLNLLPLLPLDGGKVADLLLFSRHPVADVAFKVVAAVGLPLVFRHPLSVFLTIALLVGLPNAWREAQLRRAMLRHPEDGGDTVVRAAAAMRDGGYQKLLFAQRYLLLNALVERFGETRSPRPRTLWGLGTIYLLSLLALPTGLLWTFPPLRRAVWPPSREEVERRIAAYRQHQAQEQQTELARLTALRSQYPNDRALLRQRAEIYQRVERTISKSNVPEPNPDFPKALADLDRAIALNPDDATGYEARGDLWEDRAPQKAIADFRRGLALYPASTLHHRLLGTLAKAKQWEAVIAEATACLARNPKDSLAYTLRARAYEQLGQSQPAAADRDRAERYETDTGSSWSADSLQMAEIALRRHPRDRLGLLQKAQALAGLDRTQEAIALYSQAMALLPADPNPYRLRGQLFAQQGNSARAIADANTVLAQNPNDIVALSLRADARQQSGDLVGAKRDRDRLRAVARSKQPPW